jgi:hypothetical protein
MKLLGLVNNIDDDKDDKVSDGDLSVVEDE